MEKRMDQSISKYEVTASVFSLRSIALLRYLDYLSVSSMAVSTACSNVMPSPASQAD